jgi:hypothetical protein
MSFFRTIQSGAGRMNWQGARMAGGGRAANRIERVLSLKRLKPAGFRRSLLIAVTAGALPVVCLMASARPKFVLASAAVPQPEAAGQASPAPLPAPAVSATPPPAPAMIRDPGNLRGTITGTIRGTIAGTVVPPAVPQLPRLLAVPPALPMLASNDDAVTYPYRSSSFSGWMDFALVFDDSVTMNGSDDDRREVESLRKKLPGDFVWFIHSGTAYVIRDAATVQAAKKLYTPMEELGKQQEGLGKQQEKLGDQQEELGKQMEAVRVDVPADLTQRLQAVETKIKALGGSADMDQLGRLQGEFGDLQYQLGELQRKAGEAQRELGEKQRALGEQQREFGRQQRDLGREQADLALAAAHHMQEITTKALADGTAKRVE